VGCILRAYGGVVYRTEEDGFVGLEAVFEYADLFGVQESSYGVSYTFSFCI
jgi:hypothetical protein